MNEERLCSHCGKKLASNRWVYCSDKCKKAFVAAKYRASNPFKGKTRGTTGAISELRVAVDLMTKGFHVFRSLSPDCPCDLIIFKGYKPYRIEVRTTYVSETGKVTRNPKTKARTDIYAWALPNKIVYEPSLPDF